MYVAAGAFLAAVSHRGMVRERGGWTALTLFCAVLLWPVPLVVLAIGLALLVLRRR